VKVQAKGEETFVKAHVNISERNLTDNNENDISCREVKRSLTKQQDAGDKVVDDRNDLISTSITTIPSISSTMSTFIGKEEKQDDVSPLLVTLCRQQQMLQQERYNSATEQATNGTGQVTSDPPGCRPRRLESRHVEKNEVTGTLEITADLLETSIKLEHIIERQQSSVSVSVSTRSESGRKCGGASISNNFRGLRNSATNFFRTGKGESTNSRGKTSQH